ncbi:bromodomain adjacent to zinc finger domain protein 1A isoform X2 [Corythoichthys intestinalis]|uniref:bromodomain adjacent to zinc finger domain protein 1A isoform X2 n=1 Tax=Corythoichthys intestinalis TaxID=161448 RepID=UPI0025A4D4B7|nr:bromodomain adjacent to zinc finger domain protein 1A isoform X2 [Corythoichthys intestinalis]XP_061798727.1 bromodomain adjacent to zinc finger domain protein 1A [Nerophis lumbriciformis]
MPLLHKKAFVRQEPPADLRPDEEVFLCRITHEIFRTYDEFFERTILCNSLVWSCALTGRAGLTYLEAVESERRARQNLRNFPAALIRPLLHLAALCRRGRLSELCEDIYAFTKERFFPGETVDVSGRNGARHICEILKVHSPYSSTKGAPVVNGHKSADGDTIVISDSDDEDAAAFQSPSRKKKKSLSPSAFKYEVRLTKDEPGEPFITRANQISRRKNVMSRERLKLLLKQHCEPANGIIRLKASSIAKYRLSDQNFSQFFPDDPPQFPCSVKMEARGSQLQSSTSHLMAAEEKLKLLQQELFAKAKLKNKEESQEAKERFKEEQRKRFEEEKQKRREEKERKKQEKDLEREKLKEEKKKYAERLKLWNKPREDMECEDLKDLPTPTPVRTRLPPELFGEAMMVLEFLRAFGEDFGLKDEFPDGVSLEVLEEALVGSDSEGPLCEMLFFFITAIFQALDEEQEEVATDAQEEASEAPDDDSERPDWAESAALSSAAAWSQLHLGCSLQEVDLDSCTLSEILRLHILGSSAYCNHANAKFRYQKQGGYTSTDDPCVELCSARPALMGRLACTAVYDLTPGEKLSILQALAGKLLTLASSRDLIEDCLEEQRAARQELREIRAEQHRREREEAAHRVRLRKEERLKEQEQRLKMKEQELKDGETNSSPSVKTVKDEVKESVTASHSQVPVRPLATPTVAQLEEEQEKVRELLERIQKAAACTSLHPLGRDRLYRRYWLLPSASALFVEEDSFGLTEDMLQPRPKPVQDTSADMEDVQEEPAEGSVGSSPALPYSSGPPVNRPNQWFFYSSVEELDQLLDALNPRGHRESALKEALLQERERLQEVLQACQCSKYTCTDDPESSRSVPERTATAKTVMEVRLRDLLLDIEDRIHQGTLGTLKVADRQVWRAAMEAGNYGLLLAVSEVAEIDSGDTMAAVRSLARALGHIEQGIERRFLKSPLVEEESKKEAKSKKSKKKDEDQASDDGSESSRTSKSVLERWRESLLSSSSLSQVFVHLSILERSILWSRSVLNARCRVCRRKGDADSMLLCDLCDRGHHTHCLRPRLKSIPEGEWFCPDCRPKESKRLPSRQRLSMEDEREDDEEESKEDEDEEESEEEELVVASSKKSQATPPKGKSNQTVSKSQQSTSKKAAVSNGKSTNKLSGKKTNPHPSSKTAKNNESLKNSTSSKRPPQTSRVLNVLPSLPSTLDSGSRRSSGRNRGVHELSALELLIVELVRHDDSWPFMKLVTRTQVPDYYDIITKPIALSTIREKVNNCQYLNTGDFIADVDLMFSNCLRYNARHTNEAKAGLRLQQFFHTQLKKLGLSDHGADTPPAKRARR